MGVLIENIGNASLPTTAVGIGVLVLIIVWNRLVPRVPGYIVALVAGTIVVAVAQLPLETIGTRFGGIPAGLPDLQIPRFRPDLILSLLSPTLTVAMLGAIESLLSAVVADRMSGRRHNSNVELFAQGVANIVSPMVGGLPATGAIARTATNVRSGGRTPVAGMIHACTLLVILLFASRLAALVPMAVLGIDPARRGLQHGRVAGDPGALEAWLDGPHRVVVDVRVDRARRPDGCRRSRHDHRGADVHPTRHGHDDRFTRHAGLRQTRPRAHPAGQGDSRATSPSCASTARFCSAPPTSSSRRRLTSTDFAPIVVLRLRNMTALDGTGLRAIQDFADALRATGRTLLLCGALPQPAALMNGAEFHRHVGAENILPHVEAALKRAPRSGGLDQQPSQAPPAA